MIKTKIGVVDDIDTLVMADICGRIKLMVSKPINVNNSMYKNRCISFLKWVWWYFISLFR
jgi:hypothetical protein